MAERPEIHRPSDPAHWIDHTASGGIRTYEVAKVMIEAGATRIGASASVALIGAAQT